MKRTVRIIISLLALTSVFSTSGSGTVLAQESEFNEEESIGESIYDYFSVEEIERTEADLVEIGLKKAGYYSTAKQSRNGSQTQYTTGEWDWRDGLICITESNVSGAFNNGHAGIMGVEPDYYMTYEANPGTGVSAKNGNYPTRFPGKNVWQVGVTNTTVAQDAAAATWAGNQIGKSYGFPVALSNRNKFYCSHLVYAAYLDVTGVNLDTSAFPGFIHPFELFASPETTVTYLRYLHDVTFS